MKKIIAGSLGGQSFETPRGRRTHPMADKVRGALFNALGDLTGLTVLDAFAGSGALSFEAISRGAKSVVAIDIDRQAQQVIAENIRSLGLEAKVKLIRTNCSSWSDHNPDLAFDVVISAPPYDDIRLTLLQKLVKHVSSSGLYVLDWPGKEKPPTFDGLEQVKYKNYGDAALAFYRKTD